ncbi:MAG TPA: hypothetical protein PKD29_01775 [Rhodocyclaceae bacterium]|nr:hypothetical protein [Rhodocyclaceae bacterium]
MLADILPLVDAFVRDEALRLALDDKLAAIGLAVARYSQDRPRHLVEDVVSADGVSLPLPGGWTADSDLVGAEYPIGESPPAAMVCTLYTAPSGAVFRLGDSIGAGATVRLTYTVLHTVSDVEDTVRLSHREPLAAYAAAFLLENLSAAAINDGDPTIGADSTDRRTKSQEYASRARACRKIYDEAVGRSPEGGPAASGVVVTWPSRGRLKNGIR